MLLKTIVDAEATGRVAEIFKAQKAQLGFVMDAARAFTTRADLLPLHHEFVEKVRAGFSLGAREWRLITFIAAKQVPSTYCSLVYGKQLVADLGSKAAVMAVQRDPQRRSIRKGRRDAGLCRQNRARCLEHHQR